MAIEEVHTPGILIDDITFGEVSRRYLESPFGQFHAEQDLRFSQKYSFGDRHQMLEDLGDDIHPLNHMVYTDSSIVNPMLRTQQECGDEQFDEFQVITERLAARIHDIGECLHPEPCQATGCAVGDVEWSKKDDKDAAGEAKIRAYIYDQLYSDIPWTFLSAADDIATHDSGTLERDFFQAAERLGYYLTAIRAGAVALESLKRITQLDLRTVQLSRLAVKVTRDHTPVLRGNEERFPHLGYVLDRTEHMKKAIDSQLGPVAIHI